MRGDRQQPVFIVGFARSGTTLLAGMLGAHSRMICGHETEFFTRLSSANRGNRLCRAADWPDEAANYLFSIVHEKPIPDYYGITRDEILAFLRGRKRSLSAILESLTETNMTRYGKKRWVEKTPTHLACTREIRRLYPDAPIIRIIRDPRDVALSVLNVPWGPSSFVDAVLLWQSFDECSARFFETDERSLTVRFEDLILDPECELRKVCRFIGEEFEPAMMDTSRSINHVNPTRISWKQKAGGAVDASRVGVWRRETTTQQQARAEAIVGDRLMAYGYPTSFVFNRYIRILNLGVLAQFSALADHFLDGDTRFWKTRASSERPRLAVFLGSPCANGWIGTRRSRRLARVLQVGGWAAKSRITGTPLVWLGAPPTDEMRSEGFSCRVIARLLPKRFDIDTFLGALWEPIRRRS
jgi:hypothetical protein